LAALAAMLIFTGYRLVSPSVFIKTWKIGPEQLLIFLVTIIVTLSTDLLLGIAAGILIKLLFHFWHGLPLQLIFKPLYSVEYFDEYIHIQIQQVSVFSNFILLKKALDKMPMDSRIVLDFSQARLIDHTVQENLHAYQEEYIRKGGQFEIIGIEGMRSLSSHTFATKVRKS
jgi:MFS superfamily sulfate permease-like transporter